MSGYSGTHLFQDRAFDEIARGQNPAYTGDEYQCPHSQRSYLFQYENYPQRAYHDSAGAGGCCGEPVLPFSGKPQWADMDEPARVQDCRGRAADTDCDLEIGVPSRVEQCAEVTGSIEYEGIVIRCPGMCSDMATLPNDGAIAGNHGQFIFGDLSGQEMYLKYLVDPSIIAGHYNACSGVADYVEIFCGQGEIVFTLKAGLDEPDGCGCDCCGDNGVYPGPVTVFTSPTPVATYLNTIDLSGENVKADQACPNGSISLNALIIDGVSLDPETDHEWTVEPAYHSDGVTRYWQGTPGTIGDATTSACCGGYMQYRSSNGCDAASYPEHYWSKWPSILAMTLSSGVEGVVYTGEAFNVRMEEACGYAAQNSDLIIYSAVETQFCLSAGLSSWSGGDVVGGDGYYTRSHNAISLHNSSACKKCCGAGGFIFQTATDGCSGILPQADREMLVQNRQSASSAIVGRAFHCQYVAGSDYRAYYQELRCNGGLTGGWIEIPSTSQPNWADCINQINSKSDTLIVNHCGYAGGDCATCCHYADNGKTSSQFLSRILCLDDSGWSSSPTCCDEDAQLDGYNPDHDHPWDQDNFINNSGDCCPANRPYRIAA